MTRAQFIYSELQNKGVSYVDSLIIDEVSEDLFLDYKGVATPNGARRLEESDRKNLGKAISGFGNSDGGVIIWGVNCKVVQGKGDVPSGYQEDGSGHLRSFSPVWFKSILEGFTSGATIPPHQGVEHLSLARPDRSDGVVVTYIPAGFSVPYRSITDGKDAYYIRSGSDFGPAPHGVLAALFGQRPQPIIKIQCDLTPRDHGKGAPTNDHPLWLSLSIKIKNVGRGMADDLFFMIDVVKTSFRCMHHSLKDMEWQIDYSAVGAWGGPVMAVTRPSSRRLPPGGSIEITFDLVAISDRTSDLSLEIVSGSPGGPSDSKHVYVGHAEVAEVTAIYSETPRRDRHKRHVMDAIKAKLSQNEPE